MGNELQERAQGRQAGVSAAHAVVPLAFQVIEEGHDQRRCDVPQRMVAGDLPSRDSAKPRNSMKASR
jgi:hypothetical protein